MIPASLLERIRSKCDRIISGFSSLLIMVMFGLILAADGLAADYYLSSSGNDDNAGTSASSPWRSLTRAARLPA